MESACIYEQNTVIKELTQAIQMAKELRCNLNSPVARDFLIQKILSSYENTLLLLKSCESARQATALPVFSPPDSSLFSGSPLSAEFEFDQNIIYREDQTLISRKRKGSALLEEPINGKHACYNDTQAATTLQPPPSPEKHEIKPTNYYLSESIVGYTLSNLKTNLNVNTYDLNGTTVSYSCSSPDTSDSHNITDWDSSPSLDFTVDEDDSEHYFKVTSSFYCQVS